MKSLNPSTNVIIRYRWAVIALLLLGVFLRWASLAPLSTMLHHDEAWYGLDALDLLQHPRLTPFLTNNFGRESGWVYFLIPFIAVLGASPLAVHFAGTVVGILTLAAIYRLGRECFGSGGAFWSLAALSVFYWHVHISNQALRGNFHILIGALAALALLRAYRLNTRRAWVFGGLALGLLAYTYFASLSSLALWGLFLIGLAAFDPARRRGAFWAAACAALMMLPLGYYVATHAAEFLARPVAVSSGDGMDLSANLERWAQAWFIKGDTNLEFNLPGRPILDPFTGFLAFCGLAGLITRPRYRFYGPLILAWGVMTLLPSLFSNFAPHFLRAGGTIVPIALLLGLGAWNLARTLEQHFKKPAFRFVPLLLLLLVGVKTYQDFHQLWIRDPQTFVMMESHFNEGINYLRDHTPSDHAAYFSPIPTGHPVIAFRKNDLAPRPVGSFVSHECLVLNDRPTDYVSLTMYEPDFQDRLSPWVDIRPIAADSQNGSAQPRYTVFATTPRPERLQGVPGVPVVRFGDLLEVRLLSPLPATVAPGTTISIVLSIRPLRTPDLYPSIFIHLQGDPSPYEGGPLWAQADSQICTSYPAHLWRPEETLIQVFPLALPADLPAGEYTLALGAYPYPAGARLPISAPPGAPPEQYIPLDQLNVEPPGTPE